MPKISLWVVTIFGLGVIGLVFMYRLANLPLTVHETVDKSNILEAINWASGCNIAQAYVDAWPDPEKEPFEWLAANMAKTVCVTSYHLTGIIIEHMDHTRNMIRHIGPVSRGIKSILIF